MRFRKALYCSGPPHGRIGVNINGSIYPRSSPWRGIDEYSVLAPIKPVVPNNAPAPRSESCADRNTETEADRPSNEKARCRSNENHCWIVVRHYDESGISRHDGDIRLPAND